MSLNFFDKFKFCDIFYYFDFQLSMWRRLNILFEDATGLPGGEIPTTQDDGRKRRTPPPPPPPPPAASQKPASPSHEAEPSSTHRESSKKSEPSSTHRESSKKSK